MVLIDFSQVMIANLMMHIFAGKNTGAIQPDFLRHMILNTTRAVRVKFPQQQWGEVILVCDDKDYWRKSLFEPYKHSRKKARAESKLDWEKIYTYLDQFKAEIKENFPYRLIQVSTCEGDDIIAVLCHVHGNKGPLNTGEKIKIVSGDGDFMQLQIYGNVSQYDQIKKKDIICADPEMERKMLILQGDSDDGVPNVRSPDNSFVDGIKQKPMTKELVQEYLNCQLDQLPEDVAKNWKRNEALVDLFCIPSNIQEQIIKEYENEAGKTRDKMFNYLGSKNLRLLLQHVSEF